MPPKPLPTQEPPANVYRAVHRVLYWGMLASTVCFAIGVISALSHPLNISFGPVVNLPWPGVFAGLTHFDPASWMRVATVLLIATPVVRVVLACIAFARDRDAKFVGVTGVVLGVIVLTVILGRLGLH